VKVQTASLTILLMTFWLLNSGHYTPLILSLGLASIILVVCIAKRMNVIDEESQPLYLTRSIPFYYMWLVKELVVSNMEVVSRIWRSQNSYRPAMATITIKIKQGNDMARVIYANSISLTPGTITTEVRHDSITVHALDESSIVALNGGEMEARILRLEK